MGSSRPKYPKDSHTFTGRLLPQNRKQSMIYFLCCFFSKTTYINNITSLYTKDVSRFQVSKFVVMRILISVAFVRAGILPHIRANKSLKYGRNENCWSMLYVSSRRKFLRRKKFICNGHSWCQEVKTFNNFSKDKSWNKSRWDE